MPLNESDLSVVEQPPSPPLLLTDSSINETNHETTGRYENINNLEDEVGKLSETDSKKKHIGKSVESENSSKSILILIEAVECDCDEIKLQNAASTLCNSEASTENVEDKEKERTQNVVSKPITEKSIANEMSNINTGQSAGFRPVSLAQLTARHRADNNESRTRRNEIRRDSTVDRKPKKIKRFNDTETNTSIGFSESLGAHSAAESSASEAARSLENKLLATMQILKNKEETVRVQAESLALAEARIAALSAKAHQPAHRLHQAQQTPLCSSRSWSGGCHVEMTDASSAADLQDMDHKVVNTLRDNLSVIEELYRECFYESAKQEELITMLRRAYLDMRLAERQRSEQLGRLQGAAHSQRRCLERRQDITLEVENLKSEITNFLNSAQSNDSGVWEREEYAGDVTEELRGIAEQLRRLRDMLNADCTCGLAEENIKLKTINESMEMQIGELRQRINELEEALENKENMDQREHAQIQEKEQELQYIRTQLVALEEGSRDQGSACDALSCKMKQMEVLLKDKSSELLTVQQQCAAQEATIKELRDKLNEAQLTAQESARVRDEVTCLSAQVAQWRDQLAATRRRLRALEAELQRAREQCRHLAAHYREKTQVAEELQSQLEEAQSRGTELCGEARRAVCGVRHWLRKQRKKNMEQEEKIRQQEILIQALQQQGVDRSADRVSASDDEPCCSRRLSRVEVRRSERGLASVTETGCSKCAPSRTSGSETASSPTPPTPPRRLLRKKPFCEEIRCQWPATRDAGAQRPTRSDAGVDPRRSHDQLRSDVTRGISPSDELLERVERAHEALADAHRRWARGAGANR